MCVPPYIPRICSCCRPRAIPVQATDLLFRDCHSARGFTPLVRAVPAELWHAIHFGLCISLGRHPVDVSCVGCTSDPSVTSVVSCVEVTCEHDRCKLLHFEQFACTLNNLSAQGNLKWLAEQETVVVAGRACFALGLRASTAFTGAPLAIFQGVESWHPWWNSPTNSIKTDLWLLDRQDPCPVLSIVTTKSGEVHGPCGRQSNDLVRN